MSPVTPHRRYLIVGAGRMATNMLAYLTATDASVATWSRRADGEARFPAAVREADAVLLAISDGAIAERAAQVAAIHADAVACHFSAVVDTPHAGALHTPTAFPPTALSLDLLKAIPFVQIAGELTFDAVFPMWANPVFTLKPEHRALYHAVLVIAGNLPQFVWAKAAAVLEHDAGLDPMAILQPYIASNAEMLNGYPAPTFGGPIARQDVATIAANLAALEAHPELAAFYRLLRQLAGPPAPLDKLSSGPGPDEDLG